MGCYRVGKSPEKCKGMIEKVTLDNAIGEVLEQFDIAYDGAYVYGEGTSGSQIKIKDTVSVNINKGSVLDTNISRGVIYVHYASGGPAAIFLADSFGITLVKGTSEIFRTSDEGSGVCVYKEGVSTTIKIKQYIIDLAAITYKFL